MNLFDWISGAAVRHRKEMIDHAERALKEKQEETEAAAGDLQDATRNAKRSAAIARATLRRRPPLAGAMSWERDT